MTPPQDFVQQICKYKLLFNMFFNSFFKTLTRLQIIIWQHSALVIVYEIVRKLNFGMSLRFLTIYKVTPPQSCQLIYTLLFNIYFNLFCKTLKFLVNTIYPLGNILNYIISIINLANLYTNLRSVAISKLNGSYRRVSLARRQFTPKTRKNLVIQITFITRHRH